MTEAFICDAIRTPIGRYAGALSSVRADDLAAIPIKALIDRNPGVRAPEDAIDDPEAFLALLDTEVRWQQ